MELLHHNDAPKTAESTIPHAHCQRVVTENMTVQAWAWLQKHAAVHSCIGKHSAIEGEGMGGMQIAGSRPLPTAVGADRPSRWAPLIAINSSTGHAVDLPGGRAWTQ